MKKFITAVLCLLDIGVILCASGTFGENFKIVSDVLFGIFGKMQFLMPVIFPVALIYFLFYAKSKYQKSKFYALLVAALFYLVLLQINRFGGQYIFPVTAFKHSMKWHDAGGFLGGTIAYSFLHMVGFKITKLISIVFILASLIFIFKNQLVKVFQISKKVILKKTKKTEKEKSPAKKVSQEKSKNKTENEKPSSETKAEKVEKTEKTEESAAPAEPSKKKDAFNYDVKIKNYEIPSTELLNLTENSDSDENENEIAEKIIKLLLSFSVNAEISDIVSGPAVTRYELSLAEGTKVKQVVSLKEELKLGLAVKSINILSPVPGKEAIGIEIPKEKKSIIDLRSIIESDDFSKADSKISVALGKDSEGNCIISNLEKMPHLLIAGATGSGKSVCINTIIMSILFKARPDEVKFILIDPKMVELNLYNGIPHLLQEVVCDASKAASTLQKIVDEMTSRYDLFSKEKVRNLEGYNKKILEKKNGKPLPRIVVIIDELADLMMTSKKTIEQNICRLAQLSRACGIHLVVATQRPTTNVITGLIKANIPSRIAFAVSSAVDSRVILDQSGAENLLGAGDMLYAPQGSSTPDRLQGAFVSDEEIEKTVDFISSQK